MRLSYKRVDEGFYKVYRGTQLVALMNKNPWYNRYPWIIEKASGAHFVSNSGHDCFTFKAAKAAIAAEL